MRAAQSERRPAPAVPARRPLPLRRSLPVGRTDDPLEHEADRVAREARRAPAPAPGPGRCACGGVPGPGGECAACRARRQALRRRHAGPAPRTEAPPVVHEVLASAGRPLDTATRAFFEPRLGLDLGDVRVHDDARAARSARAVNALAYAVGSDVVFAESRYSPHTDAGRTLLGHELAHVAQQRAAPGRATVRRQPTPGAEAPREAAQAVDCDETQAGAVETAVGEARAWVSEAASQVKALGPVVGTGALPDVEAAVWDNFRTGDPATLAVVAASFDALRSALAGPLAAQCVTSFWCEADELFYSGLLPTRDLHPCPGWFAATPEQRARAVIHELAHRVLGASLAADERDCGAYLGLSSAEAIRNAASYGAAAGQIFSRGAIRACPSPRLAGLLPPPIPAVVVDYAKAERANKALAQPNSLGWATKLATVAEGRYRAWADLWSAGEHDAFADEVARYQASLGWDAKACDGILGLATWSRIAGLGEAMAGQRTVPKAAEELCFRASEARLERGVELATGEEFELGGDRSADLFEVILATLENRMMEIEPRYRGTGAAGALVYAGLGEFVSEEAIWANGLLPGAAMQVWEHREAYDLLVAGQVVEDGKTRPIRGGEENPDADFYGTSYVFVRYDTENPERVLVRHFSDEEWHERSDWAVWIAANVRGTP